LGLLRFLSLDNEDDDDDEEDNTSFFALAEFLADFDLERERDRFLTDLIGGVPLLLLYSVRGEGDLRRITSRLLLLGGLE
jgi:hypothetical protein